MSVWFAIPSKRPVAEVNACLEAWRDMGYLTAVLREAADEVTKANVHYWTMGYQGWPRSTNLLIAATMARHPEAQWFVGGGDDYYPDPTKRADEIAQECKEFFSRRQRLSDCVTYGELPELGQHDASGTFGVMQPTGDRWSEGRCTTCQGTGQVDDLDTLALTPGAPKHLKVTCPDCQGKGVSAVIDRIAGSPWMGREFCRRMYHGAGPMYDGYFHNFADEELQQVARKLGVFWQRRDLVQEHRHWARPRGDWRDAPAWAHAINNPQQSDWNKSKALFAKRKAAGFPGHEPLEA